MRAWPAGLFVSILAALTTATTTRCDAQGATPFMGIAVGPGIYDLSGTGTARVLAFRAGIPLAGPLLIEPGVTFLRYRPALETEINHVFPELSLQGQIHLGHYYPYLGVGGGRSVIAAGNQFRRNTWTLHAATGLRMALSGAWGLQGELRVRAVDPFHGTTADITAGVTRRLR